MPGVQMRPPDEFRRDSLHRSQAGFRVATAKRLSLSARIVNRESLAGFTRLFATTTSITDVT